MRNHTGLAGVRISGRNHLISLFADDILLFLTDLKNSVPNLVSLIEDFGVFSGYKHNNTKSVLMFLNDEES